MSYSPKINPELVRKLYRLKHSLQPKIAMTKLVNEAVEDYLNKIEITKPSEVTNGNKLS